ncbi:MAG: hypothetical protein EXR77_12535 [Myxococcales bacterium]|nr:hypothetical protein [Myxococcales bacterium]
MSWQNCAALTAATARGTIAVWLELTREVGTLPPRAGSGPHGGGSPPAACAQAQSALGWPGRASLAAAAAAAGSAAIPCAAQSKVDPDCTAMGKPNKFDCATAAARDAAISAGCSLEHAGSTTDLDVCCPAGLVSASASGTGAGPDATAASGDAWQSPAQDAAVMPKECTFPGRTLDCGCSNACVYDGPSAGTCKSCSAKGGGCKRADIVCCADNQCPVGSHCDSLTAVMAKGSHICTINDQPCQTADNCQLGEKCLGGYCRDAW